MVVGHIVTASGGNSVKPVVGKIGHQVARSDKGAVELVLGIGHAVFGEDGFEAVLVKRLVVHHERKPLQAIGNLRPYLGERLCRVGILADKAMNLSSPIGVVIRFGADKRVEPIDYLAAAYDYHAHAAHAAAPAVGGLKIYCCEIIHHYNNGVI